LPSADVCNSLPLESPVLVLPGTWKLVALKGGPWELYDLQTDRAELQDLSKSHADTVARLSLGGNCGLAVVG
jgi:hypothetical protein